MITAYKWLPADMVARPADGVAYEWTVGDWRHQDGDIVPCKNGFHASTKLLDVLEWACNDTRLFIVEADGCITHENDKFAASDMRLVVEVKDVRSIMTRFARLCARRAAMHARDARAAARYARYASDAARYARAAARYARDASDAASDVARYARVAARYARDARAAASDARDAERRWQERTLAMLVFEMGGEAKP